MSTRVARQPAQGQEPGPDLLVGSNGRIYVNAASIDPVERKGRRVVRVLALTPREAKRMAENLAEGADELLVGVIPKPSRKWRRKRSVSAAADRPSRRAAR